MALIRVCDLRASFSIPSASHLIIKSSTNQPTTHPHIRPPIIHPSIHPPGRPYTYRPPVHLCIHPSACPSFLTSSWPPYVYEHLFYTTLCAAQAPSIQRECYSPCPYRFSGTGRRDLSTKSLASERGPREWDWVGCFDCDEESGQRPQGWGWGWQEVCIRPSCVHFPLLGGHPSPSVLCMR